MVIYIDMDNTLCDFDKAYGNALKRNPDIAYPHSQYGFYRALEPIYGALDAMASLIVKPSYDIYILTSASPRNPLSYIEKKLWLEDHLGYEFSKRLIISPNKGLLKGTILIDDKRHGNGQDLFDGRLIIFNKIEQPWSKVLEILKDHK